MVPFSSFFRMRGLHRHLDWGLLLLRCVVGIIFIYHGSMKWGMWTSVPPTMSPVMVDIFRLLSVVEPLGGIALIAGFLTQYAALGLAIIMLGAIHAKFSSMGLAGFGGSKGAGWEFDLLLLAGNVVLLLTGGGKYAIEKMMGRA